MLDDLRTKILYTGTTRNTELKIHGVQSSNNITMFINPEKDL